MTNLSPTPDLLSQADIEARMYAGGIRRAETMMEKAELAGRAHQNPYAKEAFAAYVLPLADAIRADTDDLHAGQAKAHQMLLAPLDPEAVAFIAVRTAINAMLKDGAPTHRSVAYLIGKAVYMELALTQIATELPELYHTLARDLGRRMSKDERHRMQVFRMQAEKAGVTVIEWPLGAREQIGLWLLGRLNDMGMVEITTPSARVERRGRGVKAPPRIVYLSQHLMTRIEQIKSFVAVTMPVYGPCVEPPVDWTTTSNGGFHTPSMRRTHPVLVRHVPSTRKLYREADMPIVLKTANALQRTAWAVNQRMLDTVLAVAKFANTDEIVSMHNIPKPDAPAWLVRGMEKDAMTDEQKLVFRKWKHSMADWYTARKLSAVKFGRFYSATRAADMFREYPAIHFVYFADSRGRFYPMTYGLNPQGSDLQRAMIHFAEGKPVTTPDAIRWFHVHGSNKWGFDKATLEARMQWVQERQDLLLSFASDPLDNRGWMDAASPLQFLAWCFEYAAWVNNVEEFRSHLPISMDGSCNGLQNLSALLRDEVGGMATNLIPSGKMQDIYQVVADGATKRLEALEDDAAGLRGRWLKHGVQRLAVKRAVMTTPYGVTRRSATEYIVSDYLRTGVAPEFEQHEHKAAAILLMSVVWPAIGDVVVKGREAMDWLRKGARRIVKALPADAEPLVVWRTPSGFPASQAYFEKEMHRIRTYLHGECKIAVLSESDDPDTNKHAAGLAPNFVHSMDAAHLHLTTVACVDRGVTALAMIHDDFGTHAADAQTLYDCLREQFVRMYEENDPIAEFAADHPECLPEPSRGTLNIRDVLSSPYFFS